MTTVGEQPSAVSAAAMPLLIPGLPYDVALQCIARVPLTHDPAVSLVSKPWRSLLRSASFFASRRRLRCSEHRLLVHLSLPSSHPWFSLRLAASAPYLAPLPPHPFARSTAAATGYRKVYHIVNDGSVWVYDAVLSRWDAGPRMRVGRSFPAAGFSAGKLYVIGGGDGVANHYFAEVLDPDASAGGEWVPVTVPSNVIEEVNESGMRASFVVDGRIYAMVDDCGGVVFNPVEAEPAAAWEVVPAALDRDMLAPQAAVGGVLYCMDYSVGKIMGYDFGSGNWKELKWLDMGRKLPEPESFEEDDTLIMASLGERLVGIWREENNCLYAEVEVEKNSNGELWGSIVWSGAIQGIPANSYVCGCLEIEL